MESQDPSQKTGALAQIKISKDRITAITLKLAKHGSDK